MLEIDLRKKLKHLYAAPTGEPCLVEVPEFNFLMFDGIGDPDKNPRFQDGINALYSLAFTLKFSLKKSADPVDYPVLPLEGLWWAEDMNDFVRLNKERWQWSLRLSLPEFITSAQVDRAREDLLGRGKTAALREVRFEPFAEGLCAQIMHRGPYGDVASTVSRLHEFIQSQGYGFRGLHHEIYLGDPRRCKPENLRTILRQPIQQ
jgi:hypothetical protein